MFYCNIRTKMIFDETKECKICNNKDCKLNKNASLHDNDLVKMKLSKE
jgi:hypothetical protein